MNSPANTPSLVRVWDLPTRVFHWTLVLAILGLFATAWAPGSWIDWHARLGYAVLALVLFRLAWGFVGGHWSRWVRFAPTPGRLARYLGGQPHPDDLIGHNPVGGLAIFVILLVLLLQVGTGLVSDDEIAFTGPLNRFVSGAVGLDATSWHKNLGQWLVLGLVALHVAAVVFYRAVRRTDLVTPMVQGDKVVPPGVARPAASRDDLAARVLALAVLAVSVGGVVLLVRLGT